jgi:Glucosyl transferase GtrII
MRRWLSLRARASGAPEIDVLSEGMLVDSLGWGLTGGRRGQDRASLEMNFSQPTGTLTLVDRIAAQGRKALQELIFYKSALFTGLIVSFVSRAQSVFYPQYSVDGYNVAYSNYLENNWISFTLGRYAEVILNYTRAQLGYIGVEVSGSSLIFAIILSTLTGLVFATLVFTRPTLVEAAIFIVIFTLHPFNSELFTFSDETLNISIAFFLAAIALYCAMNIRTRALAAAVSIPLFVFSLAIYQTVIASVLTVCLLALAAQISDSKSDISIFRLYKSPPVQAFIIATFSVLLYLLTTLPFAWMTGIPTDGHVDLSGIVHVKYKLKLLKAALGETLWPEEGLAPHLISNLLVVCLIGSAIFVVTPLVRAKRFATAGILVCLFIAALLWSAGASVASEIDWLVPRKLVGFATFAAGLLMMGWRVASQKPRIVLGAAILVLCTSYIGSSNRVFYDQRRINLWDQQQANRIIARLETDRNFSQIRALAIIGKPGQQGNLSTAIGDMNISALRYSWSKLGLILESSGYRFQKPTGAEEPQAIEYCKTADAWPAQESTTVLGEVGVVCLSSGN